MSASPASSPSGAFRSSGCSSGAELRASTSSFATTVCRSPTPRSSTPELPPAFGFSPLPALNFVLSELPLPGYSTPVDAEPPSAPAAYCHKQYIKAARKGKRSRRRDSAREREAAVPQELETWLASLAGPLPSVGWPASWCSQFGTIVSSWKMTGTSFFNFYNAFFMK